MLVNGLTVGVVALSGTLQRCRREKSSGAMVKVQALETTDLAGSLAANFPSGFLPYGRCSNRVGLLLARTH